MGACVSGGIMGKAMTSFWGGGGFLFICSKLLQFDTICAIMDSELLYIFRFLFVSSVKDVSENEKVPKKLLFSKKYGKIKEKWRQN